MHQYSNSPEGLPHTSKRLAKVKKHPLIMLMLLFLTCVAAWLIGSNIAGGSTEPDDISTSRIIINQDHTRTPSLPEPMVQPMSETTPYRAAAQTFTFAQLAAISNDLLLLVNPDYAVPDYIFGDLVRIAGYVTALNPDMLLNEDALVMLRAMFDSAVNVGFTQFRVTQGFRTHEYQQNLYDRMAGTGLAAQPGHSEHQVGLAVDISYHGVNIGNSVQGSWLMNYSYRYGFILRYPQNKTHITGVPFEPWHYRYVGQPHAWFMTRNDMVMEEYIDYLRINREITVFYEGVEFAIFYLDNEDEVLEIPESHQFWASRDNTGGVIVTVANSN